MRVGSENPTALRIRESLVCPVCRAELLDDPGALVCAGCGTRFPIESDIPRMVSAEHRHDAAGSFYNTHDDRRFGRAAGAMPDVLRLPVEAFVADLDARALVVEIGSGQGAFDGLVPGYVALDLSFDVLRRFGSGVRVQASAEELPFADRSIDAFFTVASLEHVPDPAKALAEIDRCLVPGGKALIYPAWYVRPWAAKALHKHRFSDVPISDRLRKLSIPIRDRPEYQFLRSLPLRLVREVGMAVAPGRPMRFAYRKLTPDLSEYVTSDSDAFTSMDPHAASAYFISRGYADVNRADARRRLLYAYEAVVVAKPRSR